MKHLITFLTTTTFALFAYSSLATETIDKTIDADVNGSITINVVRGKVTVRSWDKAAVKVQGEIDSHVKKFVFENNGKETNIEVKLKNNSSSWFKSAKTSDLTIWLPKTSSVDFVGVSTDFEAEELHRRIVASTVSGDIELKDSSNKANLQTVSGDIDVDDFNGKIQLSSVSGDINADTDSKYFKAQSVSGDIEANIGNVETADLTTVSGEVDSKLTLTEDGNLKLNTVSGDIRIKFKNDELNSCFQVNSGISGNLINKLQNIKVNQSRNSKKHINFSVGKPSGDVSIQTMSGTITLENN